MKAPKTRTGQFSLMFAAQMVSYFIIVANTRAYTHSNYLWTAITEIVFGLQAFLFSKLMVEMPELRTWYSGIGMTIGGMVGSLLAIWATKFIG